MIMIEYEGNRSNERAYALYGQKLLYSQQTHSCHQVDLLWTMTVVGQCPCAAFECTLSENLKKEVRRLRGFGLITRCAKATVGALPSIWLYLQLLRSPEMSGEQQMRPCLTKKD